MPNDDNSYSHVKDLTGKIFLCPINEIQIQPSERKELADNCVEESVVARYAGNIRIQRS